MYHKPLFLEYTIQWLIEYSWNFPRNHQQYPTSEHFQHPQKKLGTHKKLASILHVSRCRQQLLYFLGFMCPGPSCLPDYVLHSIFSQALYIQLLSSKLTFPRQSAIAGLLLSVYFLFLENKNLLLYFYWFAYWLWMGSYTTGFTWHIVSRVCPSLLFIAKHYSAFTWVHHLVCPFISWRTFLLGINRVESMSHKVTIILCFTVWVTKWLHHISSLQQGYFSTACLWG